MSSASMYFSYTVVEVLFVIRDRPFNLKGGLWYFVSFRIFFSDNTRVRILIFFVAQSAKFFPQFNIRLYDKNSESFYFFFLHQNQNIFFSNIGNQNVFFQVKWSFPNMQFSPDVCVHQYCLSLLSNIKNIFGLGKKVLAACLKAQ